MKRVTLIRMKRLQADLEIRIQTEELGLVDPESYIYGLRILSLKPIIPTIPGWIRQKGPRKVDGTDLFSTVYKGPDPTWDEAIKFVRNIHKKDIHCCIPERSVKVNPQKQKELDEYFKKKERLRQRGLMTTKTGRLRKTKYEYPENCISAEDKAKYRRKMRRLKRKEDTCQK